VATWKFLENDDYLDQLVHLANAMGNESRTSNVNLLGALLVQLFLQSLVEVLARTSGVGLLVSGVQEAAGNLEARSHVASLVVEQTQHLGLLCFQRRSAPTLEAHWKLAMLEAQILGDFDPLMEKPMPHLDPSNCFGLKKSWGSLSVLQVVQEVNHAASIEPGIALVVQGLSLFAQSRQDL